MEFEFEPDSQENAGHTGAQPRQPRKIHRSDGEASSGPVPVDGADFFRPRPALPPARAAQPIHSPEV